MGNRDIHVSARLTFEQCDKFERKTSALGWNNKSELLREIVDLINSGDLTIRKRRVRGSVVTLNDHDDE